MTKFKIGDLVLVHNGVGSFVHAIDGVSCRTKDGKLVTEYYSGEFTIGEATIAGRVTLEKPKQKRTRKPNKAALATESECAQ